MGEFVTHWNLFLMHSDAIRTSSEATGTPSEATGTRTPPFFGTLKIVSYVYKVCYRFETPFSRYFLANFRQRAGVCRFRSCRGRFLIFAVASVFGCQIASPDL
jgi:hypothetical protein